MSNNSENNSAVTSSESENNENQMKMSESKQEVSLKTCILFISTYDYSFSSFSIE